MINGHSPISVGDTVYYHGSKTYMHGVYNVTAMFQHGGQTVVNLYPRVPTMDGGLMNVRMTSITRKVSGLVKVKPRVVAFADPTHDHITTYDFRP